MSKKLFTLVCLIFSLTVFAQSEVRITSKKCIPKKGLHLKLAKAFDDSRCPEGVTCIWAGEVSATIKVYDDRKFIEEKSMTFNPKNNEENSTWFSKYYGRKVKSIEVLPYPKKGVAVKPKKQYIRIVFENQ